MSVPDEVPDTYNYGDILSLILCVDDDQHDETIIV